jgi:UDP-glucose 4-epimerase
MDRRPGDPAVLIADASAARGELGWEPRHADLRAIVESAWRWHQAHPRGYAD